jgi:DNA repair exonuclease SbcCD ATPase subunit
MQQVTIKSIQVEGFRSYTIPVKFSFNNTGLHLIKGSNGAGKTTLFSALVWCLYKVNLNATSNSKVPSWEWVRTPAYRGTRVQVVFGIGKHKYLIARHIDFKGTTKGISGGDSVLIFKKEKSDKPPFTSADIVNDNLYKEDVTAYINKLLGIDCRTFLNSILFGQRLNRLMEAKDADKRSLFEAIYNTEFIEALKTKVTQQQNEASFSLSRMEKDLVEMNTRYEGMTTQLASYEDIIADFKAKRKVMLQAISEQYEKVKVDYEIVKAELAKRNTTESENQVTLLNSLMTDVDDKREKYYTAKEELGQLKLDVQSKNREIYVFTTKLSTLTDQYKNVNTKCPACGKPLSEAEIKKTKDTLQEQIAETNAIIRVMNTSLKNLTNAVTTKSDVVNKYLEEFTEANTEYLSARETTPITGIDKLQTRRAVLLAELKGIKEKFDTEKQRQPPSIDTDTLKKSLAIIENETRPQLEKSIRIKNNRIKRLSWWAKAFGSGGLKSYIFSAMLHKLNECISVYTSYFGISIVFGIDMSKASKPFYCKVIMDGQHEVSYDELSGGQKQKIDLCISFGMQDAVEIVSSFNLSIFDEPAEFLDAEAQEMLDTLLRIKAEKKAVYVISHYNLMDLSSATVYEVSGGVNTPTEIV